VAVDEFETFRAFDRPRIRRAVDELAEKAEVETTNRKPLREPLQLLPEATWEVRVGPFRVLYRFDDGTVIVLRVILKRGTTEESL
jgi:mRNA-degrading endonuclease RelE of RelBE toxin-antitoxin system